MSEPPESPEPTEPSKSPETPEPVKVAVVSAAFLVIYRIAAGKRPSEQDLSAFADENAVFNVTPFWREFVTSSLSRAGLPPVLVPVAKITGRDDAKPAKPKPARPRKKARR